MTLSRKTRKQFQIEPVRSVIEEIQFFAKTSSLNCMPLTENGFIFDEPLVRFTDGDDPIFTEYKTIIAPTHLTPREALAKAYGTTPEDLPEQLSVISWILPITEKTRKSNRDEALTPTHFWVNTRWYGEKFNDALREHVRILLTDMRYRATAPALQPYFKVDANGTGDYSNWSERHIAYAAGHGTFSLSDGLITERGIAHRCGSVVTNLVLPASPRTARNPYSNCLFYTHGRCTACIKRCPAGAITEKGHDKRKCKKYLFEDLSYLLQKYDVGSTGCGLCQTKVPCEFRNPMNKLTK